MLNEILQELDAVELKIKTTIEEQAKELDVYKTDLKNYIDKVAELRERVAYLESIIAKGGKVHVVQPGDTLWSIGRFYGIDHKLIMEWNGLATTTIEIGQVLRLTKPETPNVPTPTVTLWGSSVSRFSGETLSQSLARVKNAFSPLEVVREFYAPGKNPTWEPLYAGIPQHISFKWIPKDVLAGKHDIAFRSWCANAPDITTWWTYWHEPEDEIRDGVFSASEYREAWKRLVGISRQSGKKLRATLCLMEWTLREQSGRNWRDYYPGWEYIDVLAWDAYYSPGRPIAEVYKGPREVSAEEGKPWAIAETAVAKGETTSNAQRLELLKALAASAKIDPKPEYVCYFDSTSGGDGTWPISNDQAAAQAWREGRG